MRKIALIGTSGSSINAPIDDESWEIWGVSSRGKHITRATRWFELHRLEGETKEFRKEWREHVGNFIGDTPLYMIYPEPNLAKNVQIFPLERITQRFGTFFLTSSFSWMIAMALDELRPLNGDPVEGHIGIWGVDMEYGTEYAEQRIGFRHFIDLARAWGIPVTRLVTGGLSFEPIPYPMWQDDPLLQKLEQRKKDSEAKITELDNILKKTRTMIAQNCAIEQALSMFGDKDKAPEEILRLIKEREALIEQSGMASKDIVHWEGVREEQGWLSDYLRP